MGVSVRMIEYLYRASLFFGCIARLDYGRCERPLLVGVEAEVEIMAKRKWGAKKHVHAVASRFVVIERYGGFWGWRGGSF